MKTAPRSNRLINTAMISVSFHIWITSSTVAIKRFRDS